MRRTPPLILGAGPAGSLAAAILARAGYEPVLIDRHAQVPDTLCGGFLSWRTAERLRAHGIDLAGLGAQRIEQLALYCGSRTAQVSLPEPAFAVSRATLDARLRKLAVDEGARLEIDTIREVEGQRVSCASGKRTAETIFLATGKSDLRGANRPHKAADPTLGLRLRIPFDFDLAARLAGRIELHLFADGYAGLVLQEDGSANLCMAVRKSRLSAAGGDPAALLRELGRDAPALGEALSCAGQPEQIDTIGAVPYGFVAAHTHSGLFRLGDQAAVIPSLAGEGIGIALASAELAARHWRHGGAAAAPAFQREFAGQTAGAVRAGAILWRLAEGAAGARIMVAAARHAPFLAAAVMKASRI